MAAPAPPPAPFDGPLEDLTLPVHGTTTFRRVLNAYWRSLVRDFATIPAGLLTPQNRALHQRVQGLAQGLLRTDPRRFVQVLREPTLSTLLVTLRYHAHANGDRAQLNRLARELYLLVLTELSVQSQLPADGVVVPADGRWPALRSIAANFVVEVPQEAAAVAFANGRITVRLEARSVTVETGAPHGGEGVAVSRPYHRIADGLCLATSDNNPLSHFEAHPDKQGNQLDLGGRGADEWVASLRASLAVVDRYLPELGREMRLCVRTIVPVGWDEHKHLSASYREAVGTIYMTLHPQLMTMTEALIHEFQHNKLNAALSLEPLLHNAFFPLYASPVRPDPRPLHGVVLAVHAFQPVAKLYEKMAADSHPASENPYFFKRFRDIIRMDRAGARTVLEHAQPTPAGAPFFGEMRRLDEELGAYEAARWREAAEGAAPDLPVDG